MQKYILLLFVICFLLSACSNQPLNKQSRSEQGIIYSPAMKKDMPYSVYLPPGWDKQEALPLIIMLHGAGGNHRTFDKYNAGERLDELILAGDLPRAIIVNPEGELGFWENWFDGTRHYRDWVVKDLMPHIQKSYPTLACPEHCHVTGISMGGHGALRFAYYEPETFSSIAVISGPIFTKTYKNKFSLRSVLIKLLLPTKRIWGDIKNGNGSKTPKDIDPFVSWVENPNMQDIRLFLTWGDKDHTGIREANELFQKHLETHQRPHSWLVYEGKHKWYDWHTVIAESVRFHIDRKANTTIDVSG